MLKEMLLKNRTNQLLMNLQKFTEGGSGEPANSTDPQGNEDQSRAFTREDIAKMLSAEKAKWDKDLDERLAKERQAGLTEGQRMAQMTEEERAKETQRQQAEATEKREQDLNRRELRLTALEELATRELPASLIEAVALTNAEECTKSIEVIEKAFRGAVETAVNERLKGSAHVPNAGNNSGAQKESIGKRLAQQQTQQPKESSFFK